MTGEEVPTFHPFEGVEKKLVMNFRGSPNNGNGFRGIPRAKWDEILTLAQCTIIEHISNDECDAYVLSESSLFVWSTKVLIKTCGTTTLFHAIPPLMELAEEFELEADAVFFNRMNFSFPKAQRYPHQNFEQETEFLDQYFAGSPYVLGPLNAERFHLYNAVCPASTHAGKPMLEVQMFDLDEKVMETYVRGPDGHDGPEMTARGGIDKIFPGSLISDVAFDPCGYSMNGLMGADYYTIHITPETGSSYVSFETSVSPTPELPFNELITRVVNTFKPGRFCVSILHGPNVAVDQVATDVRLPGFALSHKSTAVVEGDYVQTYWTYNPPRAAERRGVTTPSAVGQLKGTKTASASTNPTAGQSDRPATPINAVRAEDEFVTPEDMVQEIIKTNDLSHLVARLQARDVETPGIDMVCVTPEGTVDPSAFQLEEYLRSKAEEGSNLHDDAFFVVDLAVIVRKLLEWRQALPRVTPYYSIKCNPDPVIVQTLALLGCGFDCASKAEIDMVLQAGVPPERIIYANPCKAPSHIKFSHSHGVAKMTFDNADECLKIKELYPEAELILRIITNDSSAKCRLSSKFGATIPEARNLLQLTKELELKVVGISWHVGSGAGDISAYVAALETTRELFDYAVEVGHEPLKCVDIGGGFPGVDEVDSPLAFANIAERIAPVIEAHFPKEVEIVSEPGRFFVAESHTLATAIIARREFSGNVTARNNITDVGGMSQSSTVTSAKIPGTDDIRMSYYVSDGVYGSFNCLLYDHAEVEPLVLSRAHAKDETLTKGSRPVEHTSSVFGPTCDELDCISKSVSLPTLQRGDWLYFKYLGAYSLAAASNFNGFQPPHVYYICSTPALA